MCKKCLIDINIPLLKSGQDVDHTPPDDFEGEDEFWIEGQNDDV